MHIRKGILPIPYRNGQNTFSFDHFMLFITGYYIWIQPITFAMELKSITAIHTGARYHITKQ